MVYCLKMYTIHSVLRYFHTNTNLKIYLYKIKIGAKKTFKEASYGVDRQQFIKFESLIKLNLSKLNILYIYNFERKCFVGKKEEKFISFDFPFILHHLKGI